MFKQHYNLQIFLIYFEFIAIIKEITMDLSELNK